jgi:hypothetical protein
VHHVLPKFRLSSSLVYALLGFLYTATAAQAIIFYQTADPAYGSTAPTGTLLDSGWQLQGNWIGFLGTPISAHHFVAANHIGGSVGDPFVFNGATYTTIAVSHDAESDLTIWEVSGTFPFWATLYTKTNEVGLPLVVFGSGLSRGDEIRVSGVLKGWMWGANGGVLRWGQNRVAGIAAGGTGLGDLLYATFDHNGGPNEAHLAVGDSSGAVFIQDSGQWKLAGINYAVDAYFNTANTGSGFQAAIFDADGLYYGSSGNWTLVTSHMPSGFYATRISSHMSWINSVIATDYVGTDTPIWQPFHAVLMAAGILGFATNHLRKSRLQTN